MSQDSESDQKRDFLTEYITYTGDNTIVEYELRRLKSHCSLLSVRLTAFDILERVSAGAKEVRRGAKVRGAKVRGAKVAGKKACKIRGLLLGILRRRDLLEKSSALI